MKFIILACVHKYIHGKLLFILRCLSMTGCHRRDVSPGRAFGWRWLLKKTKKERAVFRFRPPLNSPLLAFNLSNKGVERREDNFQMKLPSVLFGFNVVAGLLWNIILCLLFSSSYVQLTLSSCLACTFPFWLSLLYFSSHSARPLLFLCLWLFSLTVALAWPFSLKHVSVRCFFTKIMVIPRQVLQVESTSFF